MAKSEQEEIRFQKLSKLREEGFAYPNDVAEITSAAEILAAEVHSPDSAPRYNVAGRLVQVRLMGKASFAHVLDGSAKIQIYIRKDDIGETNFESFKNYDLGDIVEARGYAFITKTGEKSLHVEKIRLLNKCLVPPPEKYHGLSDVELRYRQRYLDLISNPEVRETFRTRALILAEIRAFLSHREFLEVETPALTYVAGGASARPFRTHHNSLNADMFLRIALELPLKKLVVGGFERVFEIGRNFRNEGISKKHNPEFTMLEFYQAYANYQDMMNLTEEMLTQIIEKVAGSSSVSYGDHRLEFARPWKRISMADSLYEYGGVERSIDVHTVEGIKKVAGLHAIALSDPQDWGSCLEEVWGVLVEHQLVNPTFIIEHPSSISPLARKNTANPAVSDRFELIVAGMELANAFSELNDPIEQRQRFEAQAQKKKGAEDYEHLIEEDFLRALEVGLPPTAGEGIGIDRLVMLLTNSATIRDVILFPQLKPAQ